ncbi:hypothetical protein PInf_022661 [Phytophthora infestans]|nr:hypothetical protein PInf_022661 [Phytophthora infestans]
MDLKIADTEARILNYFVLFDKIVEDHGLTGILGSGRDDESTYTERMKLRCEMLLKHLAPEMLRLEMERLVIAKPVLKKDNIALYEALVERARQQQHYHMLAQELRMVDKTRGHAKTSSIGKRAISSKKPRDNQQTTSYDQFSTKPPTKEAERPRAPPRDG